MEGSATYGWEVDILAIRNTKGWCVPAGAHIIPPCALGARPGGVGFSVCFADWPSVVLWF